MSVPDTPRILKFASWDSQTHSFSQRGSFSSCVCLVSVSAVRGKHQHGTSVQEQATSYVTVYIVHLGRGGQVILLARRSSVSLNGWFKKIFIRGGEFNYDKL
jgi:hypothetical protein